MLQDNDILTVKKLIGYDEPSKIKVTGDVNNDETVFLEFNKSSFNEIISFAGGLTKYANLKSSILKRDGKITIKLEKPPEKK